MSSTVQIPGEQLAEYFRTFNKTFLRFAAPTAVDVEVVSMAWGDQPDLQRAPLAGITYDPHTNALEFEFESGDHRVYEPREVWVAEAPDGFPRTIEVVRPDGTREIATIERVGLQRVRSADEPERPRPSL